MAGMMSGSKGLFSRKGKKKAPPFKKKGEKPEAEAKEHAEGEPCPPGKEAKK